MIIHKYYPGKQLGNYHQKKGKFKLPLFCGNRERVISFYDHLKAYQLHRKFRITKNGSLYKPLVNTGFTARFSRRSLTVLVPNVASEATIGF